MKIQISALSVLLVASAGAQQLPLAVSDADLVVVATDTGVRPLGKDFILHTLTVEAVLSGQAPERVTVVEHKRFAAAVRPTPGQRRLYCLRGYDEQARRLSLPTRRAPYYKMVAHAGSNPPVGEIESDPAVTLVRAVVAAEDELPEKTAQVLLGVIFGDAVTVRRDAVEALIRHRRALASLDESQHQRLLVGMLAEREDIPFKLALAHLCAELRLDGIVPAMCEAVAQTTDLRVPQVAGRIARALHGEQAHEELLGALRAARRPALRARMLIAVGATSTVGALDYLLAQRDRAGEGRADIDAALRLHGSRRAKAILRGNGNQR